MPYGGDTNEKIIFIGGLGNQIRTRFELKIGTSDLQFDVLNNCCISCIT